MNYIGVDCHSLTLEFAVVTERGDVTRRHQATTSAINFFTFVRSVNKPRSIFIEEGELAGWLTELCAEHQETLVVTDPKRNRWISQSGQKNDKIDAGKLAQLARGNYVKPIYHPTGDKRRLKELVQAYHDTVSSQTRLKNKLKAKFRQNGIPCKGGTVYQPHHREEWQAKLPDTPIVRLLVDRLWDQLDMVAGSLKKIQAALKEESRKYPQINGSKLCPALDLFMP